MIVIKEFPDRQFSTKEEMFKALVDNKSTLIAQKKMITKESDAVVHYVRIDNGKGETVKATSIDSTNISQLKAVLVINTTNLLDSHSDVHVKGIWNKTVKESKNLLLLQEHKMTFSNIISDDVKASVQELKWSDLGYSYPGTTEALVFESNISKERNGFMFEQYAKGYVKEHSVGMRYVKLELAVNSEDKYYRDEKEAWDKYINQVANKETAEEQGYFWAVLEAKAIEGSAVVKGSNFATPTISVEAVKNTSTTTEPSKDTQALEQKIKSLISKI
jgi:hypothetical protein